MILRRPRVRDVRTRLLVIVLTTVAVGLAAATFGFNVLLAHTSQNNIDALLRQRVDSERALLAVESGRIRVSETGDDALADSRIWIFEGRRAIEAPPARGATKTAVSRLVGDPARFVDVRVTDERLYAAPISDRNGRRVGTIVAGISIAPYEETRRAALFGSLVFALVLLGLVAAAAWWLLRSALRPVEQMTTQAEAWSEHDLDGRFDLGEPHDELTRLAATLDALLDRIASSLRHERRFSAELSHELRTPLAKVIAEAELALRRDRSAGEYRTALVVAHRNAQQVARIVETLVAIAQQDAGALRGTADAYAVLNEATAAVRSLADERGVAVVADTPPASIRVGVDGDLVERVLQPLIDNACRYARTSVHLQVEQRARRVRFSIADDGVGVVAEEREAIFEPGVRGRAATGTQGAGLGLALARRLARAAAGDVTCEANGAGATFVVSLPAA